MPLAEHTYIDFVGSFQGTMFLVCVDAYSLLATTAKDFRRPYADILCLSSLKLVF